MANVWPALPSSLLLYLHPGAQTSFPCPHRPRSIVGAIGGIDAYQLPDAKGLTALQRHILGISDAERQQRRQGPGRGGLLDWA